MTTTTVLMNQDQAHQVLHQLGWKVDTHERYLQALRNFQRGWRLGPRLEVSVTLDGATSAALEISADRRRHHRPTASEHFSFSEFACHCKQTEPGCEGILVIRPLLNSLEHIRAAFYPHGLDIVSGYRCPAKNHAVHGAKFSQHLFGAAADIPARVSRDRMVAEHAFSGIGHHHPPAHHDTLVTHVDRRDRSGHNLTGSTRFHPAVFPDPA